MPLFDNLLVVFILLALGIIIYCKLKDKTLLDVIKEIREAFSPPEEE